MVSFKELKIKFEPKRGTKQRESATAEFQSEVLSANAVLKGFHVEYTKKDNRIWQQQIDLDISRINGNSVTVSADLLLRDRSGNVDDLYSGWIQCIVIANTQKI